MWLDVLLIFCVATGLLGGAWKGFSWQVAGILSLVLGFVIGLPLSSFLAAVMGVEGLFGRFLMFALAYAAISLACYAAALFLRTKLEAARLHHYDRHMGAFLGVVHGLLVFGIISMFVFFLVPASRQAIFDRTSGKVVLAVLDSMHGVLPEGVHDVLHPYMHPEPPKPKPHEHPHEHH